MSDLAEYQQKFDVEVLAAYNAGKLSAELEPYFVWKQGGATPGLQEVLTMRAECGTCVEIIWESEEDDGLLASYYDYIEANLLRLEIQLRQSANKQA